ncbi:hypothetical protein HJ590_09985 [Naumannella sp. ID2617S]|nr:hypothetical protein [Naumannella sp. ID2617S]
MATDRSSQSPLTPFLQKLENLRGLDSAVDAAGPVMAAVTANPVVKNALQGGWLSHALHPLLVQVPLGAWLSALVLDVSATDDEGRSAQLLTALGLALAAPSALSGWAELAEAGPREKRVGVVHAAANGAGILLQAAAWSARRGGHRGTARALAATSMTLIGAAGFLGGHLAVAREVGTRDPAFGRAPQHLG